MKILTMKVKEVKWGDLREHTIIIGLPEDVMVATRIVNEI